MLKDHLSRLILSIIRKIVLVPLKKKKKAELYWPRSILVSPNMKL